jgi:hypothetical protein
MRLRVWAGYRLRKSAKPSTGNLTITLHGKRPMKAQRAAMAYAKKHAAQLVPVVLNAIVAAYPTLRPWKPRPKTMTAARLRVYVQPYGLTVLRDAHDGVAYLGYDFQCRWDPSGIVVLMHRDRVVRVGGLEALEQPVPDAARTAPKPKEPTAAELRRVIASARKRAKKNPRTFEPGPDAETRVVLPEWAGFRSGPWSKLSHGACVVHVDGEGPVATAAYRRLLARALATQRVLLRAIARSHPDIPQRDLHDHVELLSAHVQADPEDKVAYVGYQLACDWEEEHGLGVLLQGDRVVEVGHADTAFLGWNADRDRAERRRSR